MELHQGQKQVLRDSHRFRVCCNGRRWGKTTLAVYEMLGFALARDDRRVLYFATTYSQARDLVWKELLKIAEGAIAVANETRLELTLRTQDGGTSQIQLRGWENLQTVRGQRCDFMVVDEVASLRNWKEGWQEVLRPTLTDTQGGVLFLSTPKGFNHFHELFLQELEDQDYKSFHFTSYENPHLPPEELEKARLELTEDRFAQEYLADFRKVEGLIWNVEEENVIEPSGVLDAVTKYHDTVIAGVDWGFHNPAAIVVAYVKDAVFYVIDEWKEEGRTTAEILDKARALKARYNIRMWYPDPAEPDRIEEMRRAGLSVGEVNKDVPLGLSHVAGLLKQKRLFIHRDCQQLLEETSQYQYERGTDGKPIRETPLKINDHLCDALRYLCMGHRPMDPHKLQAMSAARSQRRAYGFE